MEKLVIEGHTFSGHAIPTETTSLLVIQGSKGFLACGYINIDVANRLGEHVAIVTGVKSFDDMMDATVVGVSDAAQELGVTNAMTGKEALLCFA